MIKRILYKLGYAPRADVDRAYRTGYHNGSEITARRYKYRLKTQADLHAAMKRELQRASKVLAEHAAAHPPQGD